jgi:hypothetical protein
VTEFDRCAPWLTAALGRSTGGYTLSDVRDMVDRQEAYLWPLRRGAFVTIVGQYPRRRVCRIWLAGGDLAELQDPAVEAALLRHAEQNQCDAIEIIGRPGWERVFAGFRRQAVLLTRDLRP